MLNNFIYAQTKDLFLEALGAGNILDEAIVFIEDTKEIWTHGHYFDCSTLDPSIIPNLQMEVAELEANVNNKADKGIVGELEMVHAHGISNDAYAYALPDTANGDEDDVLLSQQSVKTINGETIYGSGDISTVHYGVCNTAADTAAKTVTVVGNFSLVNGAQVVIKFTNGNTADNCTLNVNNTGAKNILMNDYIKNMSIPLYTVLTFVYDGTNWLITGSSNMLTSGNTTSGYTLQIINSETAGLGISNGQSIPDTADGALCIVAETSNNAINCYSGDVVLRDGFFDGAYVHNTRVLTGNAVLNKYDSLVLYNSANSATITMPNNPVDGLIITFIKRSSSGKITFSNSTANLNAPQDDVLNKSSVTISSVGVRKLYYINSRWYIFLQ